MKTGLQGQALGHWLPADSLYEGIWWDSGLQPLIPATSVCRPQQAAVMTRVPSSHVGGLGWVPGGGHHGIWGVNQKMADPCLFLSLPLSQ